MSFDLGFTTDQTTITDLFNSFFSNESRPEVARAAEPLGFDADLWQKTLALGVAGMAVPEANGGGGASLSDAVIVAEAVGAALAPVPIVEHMVAARTHPITDLVEGAALGTIALTPAADGRWSFVPAGAVADIVIGVDGGDIVAVRSTAPGVAPRNHACQPLAHRSSRDGDRTVIGDASSFERVVAEWKTLTASTLVGIAQRSLDMGVQYVKERHQFGVPVGSFQAVQHGLADIPGLIDGSRILAHKAAWASQPDVAQTIEPEFNEYTDFSVVASMAFLFAGEAAVHATDRSLHFHGGYGFSEEYDIQMYYRRARGWRLIAGDPRNEYVALADKMFGDN